MKNNYQNKKILLFETATEEQNRKNALVNETSNTQFPIGLLYLDAVLKQKGYDVRTKDYTFWTEENCLKAIGKEIEQFKPDIVGIAMMSMTRVSAYKAIKMIKHSCPKTKIVLGGMHASMMYEQLLRNFPVDSVCIGEAEDSFPALIESIMKKKSKRLIQGIAYMENGKQVVTKQRKLRTSLDDLPFPNYDAFMNPEIREVQMTSSRGCPNRCSFCCLHITSRQVWRPRSVESVIDEIEFIVKKYPWIEEIQFIDDTFTLDNERVINICKEIIKKGIKIRFKCQGRIKPVSREMFYWMEKAGFEEICFGIETGSKKLLESIHKNITQEDCIKTFSILRDFKKIKVIKYLIVGFPGETEETVKETIQFAKKIHKMIKMNFFYVAPLWVYPGTEVYQLLKDRKAIDDSFWLSDNPCPIFTLENSKGQLIKWANKISIETMLAQGKIYFIKKAIKSMVANPKYYFNRLLNKTNMKGI